MSCSLKTARFPADTRGRQRHAERVALTDLVPHDRKFGRHFMQIDQAAFMIRCIHLGELQGKPSTFSTFSAFDLPQAHVEHQKIRLLIRALIRTTIERAYLIQQKLNQKARRTGVCLNDLLKEVRNSNFSGRVARLYQQARNILAKWRSLEPHDVRLLRRYSLDQIIDGIPASLPPWTVQVA